MLLGFFEVEFAQVVYRGELTVCLRGAGVGLSKAGGLRLVHGEQEWHHRVYAAQRQQTLWSGRNQGSLAASHRTSWVSRERRPFIQGGPAGWGQPRPQHLGNVHPGALSHLHVQHADGLQSL